MMESNWSYQMLKMQKECRNSDYFCTFSIASDQFHPVIQDFWMNDSFVDYFNFASVQFFIALGFN